jgi:CheY-like chemotaxis protein
LSESGFTVDISADGAEGLHYALEFDYDAIILDVMLPGMDGYRVLEGVRAVKQTPVLMLSARGSVDERVKGLRLGADDYLPKPFRLLSWWRVFRPWCGAGLWMAQTSPSCTFTICISTYWLAGYFAPERDWN